MTDSGSTRNGVEVVTTTEEAEYEFEVTAGSLFGPVFGAAFLGSLTAMAVVFTLVVIVRLVSG